MSSADTLRLQPKAPRAQRVERVDWNTRLLSDKVGEKIARLKREVIKDMYLGGANIAATVIPLGLIDEFRPYAHPVVLGAGKLMFPRDGRVLRLGLQEATTLGSGVVLLRYKPSPDTH